jgi:hypothetical protein
VGAACARVDILRGEDPAETVVQYARSHGVTQIFVGHNTKIELVDSPLWKFGESAAQGRARNRRTRHPELNGNRTLCLIKRVAAT